MMITEVTIFDHDDEKSSTYDYAKVENYLYDPYRLFKPQAVLPAISVVLCVLLHINRHTFVALYLNNRIKKDKKEIISGGKNEFQEELKDFLIEDKITSYNILRNKNYRVMFLNYLDFYDIHSDEI